MNMNRQYRAERRNGATAREALRQARYLTNRPTFDVPDGFTFDWTTEGDPDGFESGFDRGVIDWCDRSHPGAVPVWRIPRHTSYTTNGYASADFGEPDGYVSTDPSTGTLAEMVERNRARGMARHDAYVTAMRTRVQCATEDLTEPEDGYVIVVATLTDPWGSVTETSLGGLGGTEYRYHEDVAAELLGELLHTYREAHPPILAFTL